MNLKNLTREKAISILESIVDRCESEQDSFPEEGEKDTQTEQEYGQALFAQYILRFISNKAST